MPAKLPEKNDSTRRKLVIDGIATQALATPDWKECFADLMAKNGISTEDVKKALELRTQRITTRPIFISSVLWFVYLVAWGFFRLGNPVLAVVQAIPMMIPATAYVIMTGYFYYSILTLQKKIGGQNNEPMAIWLATLMMSPLLPQVLFIHGLEPFRALTLLFLLYAVICVSWPINMVFFFRMRAFLNGYLSQPLLPDIRKQISKQTRHGWNKPLRERNN